MDKNTSQAVLARNASSISASGNSSSNQTTSGRSSPPQFGHLGGTSPVSCQLGIEVPSLKHFVRVMLPWSSITLRLPAR